jgi:hypothetical protein
LPIVLSLVTKLTYWGGGIGNSGTLTFIISTISYNTAVAAGGAIDHGYTLSLENSTIAYNSALSSYDGGLAFDDGGQASIFQSTIYGNTAATSGGNIHTHYAPIKLVASIIAGGNARQGKDISGRVISFGHGYNLIGALHGATIGEDATPIYLTGSPYEVQMKIVTGDGGGIAFRIDPKTQEQRYYYFVINQDGSYSIQANDIVLASGSSSAINRGLNQTNLVAAVVHGQIIELYVNFQRVAVVSDAVGSRADTHGGIGVIVTPSGHQTEVIFQNAKVWTL